MAVTQRGKFDPEVIQGVLTRLPYVHHQEVPHVVLADRVYVAAEIQAFLFAWISGLRCPVLNRPTAFNLSGPAWRSEQWLHLAAHVGLSIDSTRLVIAPGSRSSDLPILQPSAASVTIVGENHVGLLDSTLISQAHKLAAAAGVDLLTVTFSSVHADAKFIGATLWPNPLDPSIGSLIVDYFKCRARPALED